MKLFLRISVAFFFIISGFVKAVDPIGFAFKLEEYFGVGVFNLPILMPLALPIAVAVSSAEVLLGVMLLYGIRFKTTLVALSALCLFFAFLTFYSAYFNVVTDCGCFGDAVKFSPWQSFIKDILLLVCLILLWFLYREEFIFNGNKRLKEGILLFSIFILIFLAFMGIRHEPVIDFRDYKLGTDLVHEKEKIAAHPSEYTTVYVLKNKITGERKRVIQDDYMGDEKLWQQGTPWQIQKAETTSKISRKGYSSEISKFKILSQNGEDITAEILASPYAVLLFCYDPKNADAEIIKLSENKIIHSSYNQKLGIAPSFSLFKKLPAANMDATAIKTIARSNPFVLILKHGKIVGKKSARDFLND